MGMNRTFIPISFEVRDVLRELCEVWDGCSYDSLLRILIVDHRSMVEANRNNPKLCGKKSEMYLELGEVVHKLDGLIGEGNSFKVYKPGAGIAGRPKGAKDLKQRVRRAKLPGLNVEKVAVTK